MDFIPIDSVDPGDGVVANTATGDTVLPSVVVKMNSKWTPSDGVVHFMARFYYLDDETDPANLRCVRGNKYNIGQNNNYDIRNPTHPEGWVGFTIPSDQGATPPLTNLQGQGHNTGDYQTFKIVGGLPNPIYVLVLVHKENDYKGHHTSMGMYEFSSSWKLTAEEKIRLLQLKLDREAAGEKPPK